MRAYEIDRKDLGKSANTSLAVGGLLILLGAFAIGGALTATLATVIIFGWVLVAAGVLEIAHVSFTRDWGTVMNVLVGVLYAVVGMLMITRPGVGAAGVTLMLAALFVVVGSMRIITALSLRYDNWGWSVFSGIAAIALGALIWSGWPGTSVWLIGTLVGIELMMWGVSLALTGMATRRALKVLRRGDELRPSPTGPEARPPLH